MAISLTDRELLLLGGPPTPVGANADSALSHGGSFVRCDVETMQHELADAPPEAPLAQTLESLTAHLARIRASRQS